MATNHLSMSSIKVGGLGDLGFCLLASYAFRGVLFFKFYEILTTGSLENSLFPLNNESQYFGQMCMRGNKDEKCYKKS